MMKFDDFEICFRSVMLVGFLEIMLGSPTLTIAAIIGFTIIRLSSDKMFHQGKRLLNDENKFLNLVVKKSLTSKKTE